MEKTWRWFGRNDKITLPMLRQIGVEGIVTALHDVKNGEVWTRERITELRDYIESFGLRWSVVESLPVSESIKYGGADRDGLISNYIESLRNLGACGIRTVCYNFMPVLDWARTDLANPNPDGTSSLYFNLAEFAYFDCRILRREGAEADYAPEILAQVDQKAKSMTAEDDRRIIENIIIKTQGFVNGNIKEGDRDPVNIFRGLLELYKGIDKAKLRANLKYFLEAVMPVCNEAGVNMCVHPDDPPMQILGLPRIVCNEADIRWMLDAVPDKHNGLTFCAGSLSAGMQNDVPALARQFARRTHFVHLRSTCVFPDGSFKEASHFGGRANIIELIRIFEAENPKLPMRVDHAPLMLGDEAKGYNAGYSFHGRMMALGQVEGMMAVVDRELGIERDYPVTVG
ncbi:MAG: mannonate dehydratase [Prevotella sp.]|nr:mannonate dehydratase [Prevotella sp.]